LTAENPELAMKSFKKGFRKYVSKVAQKSGKRSPQNPQRRQAPKEMPKSAKEYTDSNDFLDDVISSVLPDDDPIWRV
jgi:hypothetical protein